MVGRLTGLMDETRTATRKVKAVRQTASAQHFALEFRRIATKLAWDDESQMELFYDGLKEDMKYKLYKIDQPEAFDTFVEMAIKIDDRSYARALKPEGRDAETLSHNPGDTSQIHGSTAYEVHSSPMKLDASGDALYWCMIYNLTREAGDALVPIYMTSREAAVTEALSHRISHPPTDMSVKAAIN
ncbi:hypothetical protein NLG97_g1591 [Lecanicillium saksenae]|uniref:Uncharacterized protein n=1 Tax=Lecanicillium saksenae TaxID=468837 RepID=A0ACC1R3B4_9HYPO|nr:hypothetical protein NLG97_g1591 [Lecanicillium saksenae]